jgi:hypothetical protein
MTGIRRIAVLLGLPLVVVIGTGLPASADFAGGAAATTGIATGTVAAPATITVNDYCLTTTTTVRQTVSTDPTTGTATTTYYSSTSTSAAVDADNLSYGPALSVSTLTSYGWTAESPRSAVLSC